MFISDMNMDELSNRLMISVMNLKKNQLSLENYPYIVKGDMAVVAQLCVGEKNADGLYNEPGSASIACVDSIELLTKVF